MKDFENLSGTNTGRSFPKVEIPCNFGWRNI